MKRLHDMDRGKQKIGLMVLSIAVGLLFIASSNGVGEQQNRDRSGSPDGDNTCGQCHNGGNFNPTLSIEVADSEGNLVQQYIPGAEYEITYRVQTANPPFADGFGFQSTVLVDADLSNAGELFEPGFGVQIQNVSNLTIQDRTVVEHSALAPVGTFRVNWQAPEEDLGAITIYAAGNAVNGNGASSGDASINTQLTLTPDISSSLFEYSDQEIRWAIVGDQLRILSESGPWDRIELWEMSGRLVWSAEQQFSPLDIQLPENSGIYGLRLIQGRGYLSRTIYLP